MSIKKPKKVEYIDSAEFGSVDSYIRTIEDFIYPQIRCLESYIDYQETIINNPKSKTKCIGEISYTLKVDSSKYEQGLKLLCEIMTKYNIAPVDIDNISKILIDLTIPYENK